MAAIDAFEAAAQEKRSVLLELLTVQEHLKNAISSESRDRLTAQQIDLQVAHVAAEDRMRVADMRCDAYKIMAQHQQTVNALTDFVGKMYAQEQEGTPHHAV